MRGRPWGRRRAVALVALAAALAADAGGEPAAADCVYLDLKVTREDTTPVPVSNGCIVNTMFPHRVTAVLPLTSENIVPSGQPNGVFVDVRVPVP